MNLQLVKTVYYEPGEQYIHIFYDTDSGQSCVMAKEIAELTDYASLHPLLRKNPLYHERHTILLQGALLQEFLQKNNIPLSRNKRQLLLVREIGLSLLLGKSCKKEALIVLYWLIAEIFPTLRAYRKDCYYAWILSKELDCEILAFLHKGRLAFLEAQIAHLSGSDLLENISSAYDGYIENVHVAKLPMSVMKELDRMYPSKVKEIFSYGVYASGQNYASLECSQSLFYEGGIYRYLCLRGAAISLRFQRILEQEIFSEAYFSRIKWQEIKIENDSVPQSCAANMQKNSEKILTSVRQIMDEKFLQIMDEGKIIAESFSRAWNANLKRESWTLLARIDGFVASFNELLVYVEKNFNKLYDILLSSKNCAENSSYENATEKAGEHKNAVQKTSVLEELRFNTLKEIACVLGVYFSDRHTPHIVFVKALVDHMGTYNAEILQNALREGLKIKKGENLVQIPPVTYRVWKE